jgi:hypothetical protein
VRESCSVCFFPPCLPFAILYPVSPRARKGTSELTERVLVFVDAPHILLPADIPSPTNTPSPSGTTDLRTDGDLALRPRAWWKRDPEPTLTVAIDETLGMFKDVLRKDRFDVS